MDDREAGRRRVKKGRKRRGTEEREEGGKKGERGHI